jgi:NADH:ubiquinone oxidoreductase subunit K
MQNWLNFWIFLFWISLFSFILNYYNFLLLLLFSEFVWLVLYCFVIFTSCKNDDFLFIGLSFLFLGLAGLEFSIGLLILILFKNLNFSLNIYLNDSNEKIYSLLKKKNYYFFENFLI